MVLNSILNFLRYLNNLETPIDDSLYPKKKKKTNLNKNYLEDDNNFGSASLKVIQTPHQKNNTPASLNYNRPSCVIVSIIEYRQKREVGIAIINLKSATVTLYQIADSQRYGNIIMILHQQNPNEIIISDTTTDTTLTQIIKNEFECIFLIKYINLNFNLLRGSNYRNEKEIF